MPPAPRIPALTLFLMTQKGFFVLSRTIERFRESIGLVVVGSDKTLKKDFETEIIALCEQHNVPHIKREAFTGAAPTPYAMAIAWRWMLDHPSDRLVVLHDSLLPKYRGFSPLINALVNGEKETGVTALFGASEFDKGDIIFQSTCPLSYPITIGNTIDLLNEHYAKAAIFVMEALEKDGKLNGKPQDESKATYSIWLDELDYHIDWRKPAADIRRFIDALGYPYNHAYSMVDGVKIRILSAEVAPDLTLQCRHIGKALYIDSGKPLIICGSGLLQINEARVETKDGFNDFLPLKKMRLRFV